MKKDNRDNLPSKDSNEENNNNNNNNNDTNDKDEKDKKKDINDWEVSVADLREIVASKIDQDVLDTYRCLLYQYILLLFLSSAEPFHLVFLYHLDNIIFAE